MKPTPHHRETRQHAARPIPRSVAARMLRAHRSWVQSTVLPGLSSRYQFGEQTLTVPRLPRQCDIEFWQRRDEARGLIGPTKPTEVLL